MSDTKRWTPLPKYDPAIPTWAVNKALDTVDSEYLSNRGPRSALPGWSRHVIEPLARMIAKHEQPPADKYEVALNAAMNIIYSGHVPLSSRQLRYRSWNQAIESMKRIINES